MEKNQNGENTFPWKKQKAALQKQLGNPGNWFPYSEYTARPVKRSPNDAKILMQRKRLFWVYCMTSVRYIGVDESTRLPDTSIAWNVDGKMLPESVLLIAIRPRWFQPISRIGTFPIRIASFYGTLWRKPLLMITTV